MGVVNSSPVSESHPPDGARCSWMGELLKESDEGDSGSKNNCFGQLKLFDISIPGSHNSGTFQVESNLVSSLASCQAHNFKHQLNSGIRFLDLRICDDVPDALLMLSHRFLCGTLSEALHHIYTFLMEQPTEIVIVAIKKDWDRDLSDKGINRLRTMISNHFSELMITKADAHKLTISELIRANKRINFISDELNVPPLSPSTLHQSWQVTNSTSNKTLIKKLDQFVFPSVRQGYQAYDCYITPNAESVTKWCVQNRNWHQIQKDCNASILGWLHRNADRISFNVILTDMIDQDVIDFIIDLNRKPYCPNKPLAPA